MNIIMEDAKVSSDPGVLNSQEKSASQRGVDLTIEDAEFEIRK